MSSGWTQKLNSAAAASAASSSDDVSSSSSAAAERVIDADYLGQGVSSALAQRFEGLIGAIAADNDDGSAQQEMMDRLRLSIEGNGEAPSTEDVSLTLASFSQALHKAQSFSLLAAQYTRMLDQLSWDLCDVFLPALAREWSRVAATTEASGVGDFDSSVDAVAAAVSAQARPLASPVLGLLLHLLEEIAAHANPREIALTLLAFYEKHVHDDDEQATEEDDASADDQEHEEENKPATAAAATANSKLSTFHRLGLAFPLLDLMNQLMTRLAQPSSAATAKASADSAASAAAPAASSSLVLSNRQVELYQQLLVLLNSTLARIGHEVYARSESQQEFFDRAADRARFHRERNLWVSMHTKMGMRALEIVAPVLAAAGEAASAAAAPPAASSSAAARAAAAAPPSSAAALRSALLSFLFHQLFRFWSLYSAEAPELQAILDGNRAHAAESAAAAVVRAQQPSAVNAAAIPSSLTPRLIPLLSLLFHLMSALDSLRLTPGELWSHFVTKRSLEKKIEAAEMDAWEREDDTLAGVDEEEEDEEGSDGNAHDDEYDSGDEFGENAALKAFDRQRKPPSLLSQLRKAQHRLPNYNIQGVGLYCATALGFQYFTREKPRRAAAAASATAAAPAAEVDQPLAALLATLPDIGSGFFASCASAPSLLFLNSISPYLSGLLFHGLSSGEAHFVGQAVALSTAAWALIPPGAVCIAESAAATGSGGQSGAASESRNLESSGVWMLNESVLQGLFLCPPSWPSVRSSLLLLWKNLLSCLGVNTRARLLQLSISVCSVPSIQAVVLQRLKDEIVSAWAASEGASSSSAAPDSDERVPTFLNADLLATLHGYVSQAAMELQASIDPMMALINLFRFCLIREKADAETTPAATGSSSSVVAAAFKSKGGRVGLLLPAVRAVWVDQWRTVAAQATELAARLDDEIAHPPKPKAGRPVINLASSAPLSPQEAKEDAAQAEEERLAEKTAKILMRNQVQMAAELCKGIVEQLA